MQAGGQQLLEDGTRYPLRDLARPARPPPVRGVQARPLPIAHLSVPANTLRSAGHRLAEIPHKAVRLARRDLPPALRSHEHFPERPDVVRRVRLLLTEIEYLPSEPVGVLWSEPIAAFQRIHQRFDEDDMRMG